MTVRYPTTDFVAQKLARDCPYCDEDPCFNVGHALDQAAYFARVGDEAFKQRDSLQASLDEAVELLRGIVEDDCGKLRARHWLSLLEPVAGDQE
jgi:hypothetical protein